jgi:hypothetical protein
MRVWDNRICEFVDDETGELFAEPDLTPLSQCIPAPVQLYTVRHQCGCPRTLRFAPESDAGREFIERVEASACRVCRRNGVHVRRSA